MLSSLATPLAKGRLIGSLAPSELPSDEKHLILSGQQVVLCYVALPLIRQALNVAPSRWHYAACLFPALPMMWVVKLGLEEVDIKENHHRSIQTTVYCGEAIRAAAFCSGLVIGWRGDRLTGGLSAFMIAAAYADRKKLAPALTPYILKLPILLGLCTLAQKVLPPISRWAKLAAATLLTGLLLRNQIRAWIPNKHSVQKWLYGGELYEKLMNPDLRREELFTPVAVDGEDPGFETLLDFEWTEDLDRQLSRGLLAHDLLYPFHLSGLTPQEYVREGIEGLLDYVREHPNSLADKWLKVIAHYKDYLLPAHYLDLALAFHRPDHGGGPSLPSLLSLLTSSQAPGPRN